MKLKFFLALFSIGFLGVSQTILPCGTNEGVNILNSNNQNAIFFDNTSKCVTFRLYFHFLRQDQGFIVGGDPVILSYPDYINARITELHSFFPENIRFESIGHEIFESSDYNSNSSMSLDYTAKKLFNEQANSIDAIDVFFMSKVYAESSDGNNIFPLAGQADGIPSFACAATYSQMESRPTLLSHELGHCVNLYHTHHGLYGSEGSIIEDPDDCENTGDYVCDTPADGGLFGTNEDDDTEYYVDDNCNYIGTQFPAPLTDNIMSYFGHPDIENDCSNNFTSGQIARTLHPSNLTFFDGRMYIDEFDLAMRDNLEDELLEPNYTTDDYDNSPDLWVRNNNTGDLTSHQNPIFNHPIYGDPSVRLRIINNGCSPNTGTETVSVYWTKANTWTAWPDDWNGPDTSVGAEIGTVTIPVIEGGESEIVTIQWSGDNIPDLATGEQINSCILARINGGSIDPIDEYSGEMTHNLWVRNNNVVLRNLTILNFEGGIMAVDNSSFEVQNVKSNSSNFDFDIVTDQTLLNEAELFFVLPNKIFSQYNLASNSGVKIHPRVQNAILVTQPNVALENISLDADERLEIQPKVNFLRSQVNHESFSFRFSQRHDGGSEVLGSEHYQINRSERNMFEAKVENTGNIEVLQGESVDLLAEDIGEGACYNWYDISGNLLFTGKDISLTAEQTQKLKLEVITDSDKYIDYDEKTIHVKLGMITGIAPQPVSYQANVSVKLSANVSGATIMLLNSFNQPIGNYIVTGSGESTVIIDLSSSPSGWYQTALIINGIIADTQNFTKQ